jgi:hypothetical protein
VPNNSISMTNLGQGATITSPFVLNISYTLVTSGNGQLTITSAVGAGIAVTPQPATTSQTPSMTSATLTYVFPLPPPSPMPPPPPPITGETVTVNLFDSGNNLVATASAGGITVNPS